MTTPVVAQKAPYSHEVVRARPTTGAPAAARRTSRSATARTRRSAWPRSPTRPRRTRQRGSAAASRARTRPVRRNAPEPVSGRRIAETNDGRRISRRPFCVSPRAMSARDEVVVDVLAPVAVDTAYSYRAPSDWKLEPGAFVRVPLGTRQATGVVWAVARGRRRQSQTGRGDPRLAAARARPCAISSTGSRAGRSRPRGMVLRMAIRAGEVAEPPPPRNSASSRPASRPRG